MLMTKTKSHDFLINLAILLSIITILYNIGEGIISLLFGYADETLSLFGFGVDSFVEVLSGAGILHMVLRFRKSKEEKRDGFEKQALFITGIGFFILAAGLVIASGINIVLQHKPVTTFVGIIISGISIATMWLLMRAKLYVGKHLKSEAIVADAHCTRTCFYLSFILLGASLMYEFFKIPYIDAIGSLGIAFFAFKEGREAMEKAKNNSVCSCGSADSCKK
ncbi:MAG: cation transporter [Spirochaetales bacterium]|nr:cation transporter [Spirochaetales bacterium]